MACVALVLSGSALLLWGQSGKVETLERNFRPHVSQGKFAGGGTGLRMPEPLVFQIEGASYRSWMAAASLQASPDWTASQPMPVSFARLEQVARGELAKLVTDDASWSVRSFQLHSIPQELSLKWYFVIEMKPVWEPTVPAANEPDSFRIYIDLAGTPGTIRRL